jgi:dihydrofolate synthase/folylpolyglutamate synthase
MNEINKILQHLFSLQHSNMNHGLGRIKSLLKQLNSPHKQYPVLHIAGTNGKGSVCSFVASILQENGLKVGLYTSPHIIDFNERIRVNGIKITDEEIAKNYKLIEKNATKINASFFEITTAIAFEHFKNSTVDIAVIETGLGGRFDSTNVVEPILSIITTIGKDHCQLLGDTVEKIATEKAGIIKKNSQVLIQDVNIKLLDIWQQTAAKKSSELFFSYKFPTVELKGYSDDLQMIFDIALPSDTDYFILPENLIHTQIKTNFIGFHQIANIRTAVFAALLVSNNLGLISNTFSIKTQSIVDGIKNISKNTGFRYRIECVQKNPYIIIDVAHNPQSINRLVNAIKDATVIDKWDFIFGAMKDKDITRMLEFIRPICRKLIIVSPQIERAASVDMINEIATSLAFEKIVCEKSISSAVKKIKKDSHTIICGSFYVIEETVRALRIK